MSELPIQPEIKNVFPEKDIVEFQKHTADFIEQSFGQKYDFLESQAMLEEVANFGREEYSKLSSALADANWGDPTPEPDDISGLGRVAVELLSRCKKNMEEISPEQKELLAGEVSEIVSDAYGVDVTNMMSQASLTESPKSATLNLDEENLELSDELKAWAEKKFLADLYIHGRSLNDLGGMYAYFQEKGFKENALHRALASALHIINTKTAMLFASQGGLKFLNEVIKTNPQSAVQLGRMEIDENSEGELSFKAEGMTPSELAHEEIKGILEYASLDTTLPAEGEITEEQAQALKNSIEEPVIEIIAGIYGPILSKKLDHAFGNFIETANQSDKEKLASMLDVIPEELSKPLSRLRFFKLFTMQNKQDMAGTYEEVMSTGTLSIGRISIMKTALELYKDSA